MAAQYPVIINVRDRLSALLDLLAWLEKVGQENVWLCDNASTYEPMVEFLHSTTHRVVFNDLNLGHRGPWLSGLVTELGLDRPFGVGHSKGAASLLLAEQARPGTFRALWLYEPVVVPTPFVREPDSDNPLSAGALRRRATFTSRDEAYDNYASKPPFSSLHPEVLRLYVDHGFTDNADGTVSLKCAPADEAAVYAHGLSHHAFAGLSTVRCPTTIAVGHDEVPPAVFARPIAEALPDGRLVEFDQLGHFGPLEDPDVVAAAIRTSFAGTGG